MADADRDTVLAWMTANKLGAAAASRHFGIPRNRIYQWEHKARQGAAVNPTRPHLTILPPPEPVKVALPPDLETLAQAVIRMSLATLVRRLKEGDASINDCAKAIAAITDRLDAFGSIAKQTTAPAVIESAHEVAAEMARRRRVKSS
jgi:transposase-like protein